MKKLFLLACLVALTANATYAQHDGEADLKNIMIGPFNCALFPEKGTATILRYTPDSAITTRIEATIPQKVEYEGKTYRVTGVEGLNESVFSVNVPSCVTYISRYAFDGVINVNYKGKYKKEEPWGAYCRNKYIDGCLIYEDVAKTRLAGWMPGEHDSIRIPDRVKNYESVWCKDCYFRKIELGEGVKHIKKNAFDFYLSGVGTLVIPDAVKSIESKAFSGGYGTVIMSSSVRSIGSNWINDVSRIYFYAKSMPVIIKAPQKPQKRRDDYYNPFSETELYVPEKMANKYNNHSYWHQFRIRCIEEPLDELEFGLSPARVLSHQIQPIDTLDSEAEHSFQLLLDSATLGDSWSQLRVGLEYLYGDVVPADTAFAYQWISKAAAQNNREAIYYQYLFLCQGWGVAKDMKKGYEQLIVSTTDYTDDQSVFPYSADGVCSLGVWYLGGDKEVGVRRNYKKAVKCFRKVALETPSAMRGLGYCYRGGYGVKRDYYKALLCMRVAANSDDAVAMYELGYMYYMGIGTLVDLGKALYWLEKADANGIDVEEFLKVVREEIEIWEDEWGEDYPQSREYTTKFIGNILYRKSPLKHDIIFIH